MRLTRWRTSFVVMFMVAAGPGVACAKRDDRPAEPPIVRDPGSTLEAGASDRGDDARAAAPTGCSESGFCYVPVPAQNPLIAVSASSADDAWMLPGQSGALLRWDGTEVKEVYRYESAFPTGISFTGIWAQKKDAIWATADGSDGRLFLVRYAPTGGDAPKFRELRMEEPSLGTIALWGTPEGDAIWIANHRSVLRIHENESGAVVEHLDPSAGAEDAALYTWHGVWGFGAEDVWVAGSACPAADCVLTQRRGVLAHYDGSAWSILTIEGASEVLSLRGTPSGAERQFWYDASELKENALGGVDVIVKTYLAPLTADGELATPLYEHSMADAPACSSRVGHAAAPASGWFSDGLLVCRWTGTAFERASTVAGGRPLIYAVNGIWAGGGDDAWIVGTALARTNLPQGPFAARRTAATATGAQP